MDDKETERIRYDSRAEIYLDSKKLEWEDPLDRMPDYLRSPYIKFIETIQSTIESSDEVLEIGAGKGNYTKYIIKTGAKVIASDISEKSVELMRKIFNEHRNFTAKTVDMENLPFENHSFDVLVSAGSLSYGQSVRVLSEIFRVLKKNGNLVIVDSLDDNPIYRLNRYLHYFSGNRSYSVIKNCPKISLLNEIEKHFSNVETSYYGKMTWAMPIISKLTKNPQKISDFLDQNIGFDWLAFKFVLCAREKYE